MSYVETEGEKGGGSIVWHLRRPFGSCPPFAAAESYQQARSLLDRERQMTIIMGCGGREGADNGDDGGGR